MFRFSSNLWFGQMVRFGVSGGLATGLHWGVMALAVLAGVDALYASASGALAGAVFNYVLQFHFTFKSSASHRVAVPVYVAGATVSWWLNLLLFAGFHLQLNMPTPLAQVLTTVLITVVNFFWYKRVVFNERTRPRVAT